MRYTATVLRDAHAIPLLDLQALHAPLREQILAAVAGVIDRQAFILGPEVARLESEIAGYCQARFAVGCASGSDALLLALLSAGIRPEEEVLTSPFSFFATAGAIHRAGARPVFADVDPVSLNLDPGSVEEVLSRRRGRVRAIIPVHLYGGCADMDPILALARQQGITVIEDGAQAIGAEYKGRRALSLADYGCLSFYPSKNLGALGDGGMVTCADPAAARRLASLRGHGSERKYYHEQAGGFNSRLDNLQAAVLLVKLAGLDLESAGRQCNARRYCELLRNIPVRLPQPQPWQTRHVWNQFTIRAGNRDRLRQHLAAREIGSDIYYPLPLHLQPCFSTLGYRRGDLPNAEQAADEVLSLPIHSALKEADLARVCESIEAFYV